MNYYYNFDSDFADAFGNGFGRGLAVTLGVSMVFIYIISIIIGLITIVALWMLFEKARENGWASIIPFYNNYVLYKITWGSGWYFLLLFIPIANIVINIITMVKLANVFGKGGGWACGLIFLYPIFICILAFDKSIVYVGDYAGSVGSNNCGGGGTTASFYKTADGQEAPPHDHPKYCPSCGAAVGAEDRYCLSCGRRL